MQYLVNILNNVRYTKLNPIFFCVILAEYFLALSREPHYIYAKEGRSIFLDFHICL